MPLDASGRGLGGGGGGGGGLMQGMRDLYDIGSVTQLLSLGKQELERDLQLVNKRCLALLLGSYLVTQIAGSIVNGRPNSQPKKG